MPQFLLTALGSYGDVHPMVGLASALAARGHRVKVATNPYFADVVASAGVELLPLSSSEEYVRLSQHPDLWHPVRGPRLVLSYASARLLRPLYDLLMANYVPGETVFCAMRWTWRAAWPARSTELPSPVLFSRPVYCGRFMIRRGSKASLGAAGSAWLKRAQFWMADRLFMLRLLGPECLNKLRGQIGLSPVNRVYNGWLFESDLILGLFPDWFGPPQPDWPANTHVVGFPLWDSPGSVSIPRSGKLKAESFDLNEDVRDFLAAGTPPIAFSPGSANREAHSFFEAAVDACERLGRRGILMTKYDHQLPATLPDSVLHVGFLPMSKLLPQTAALVHHGGIGSCAQGLAAGVPQIVRPMSYDQFDNSRRLVRLGVAKEISVRKFSGERVASALSTIVGVADNCLRCRELAARCDGRAALAAACDELERLVSAKQAARH